jgi:hypothetical protein
MGWFGGRLSHGFGQNVCSLLYRRSLIWQESDTAKYFPDSLLTFANLANCCVSFIKEDWKAATVVNMSLVDGPAIRQPGFNLQQRQWSLLNRFHTGQGPCRANLKQWGMATDDICKCGASQTMDHIISVCPLIKLDGGLYTLHKTEQAVSE